MVVNEWKKAHHLMYIALSFTSQKKTKYSATRRLHLKSILLRTAASMLLAESEEKRATRERFISECFPLPNTSDLSVQELQELCKELHRKIDVTDEARYDIAVKVEKNENEIVSLRHKLVALKGVRRPSLKRVKKSTEDMLGAYSDSSKLMKADFKANLKTVKKEDEKREEVTDWRKNVEAMSGMEGRKKLFNAGQ
ncbi:troponin I, slow skeletal muscle-like isoform X1 [Corythoichthys intestinalis]|uniref:troponin I, slow skeletal muscle-like isoform X1 n=1 Tax=Corythoichthys intestinalis TaxID=161448 RepID=UPI0025A57775|nr:troponin I, slow skeletal muscle-like isoform X1 [Corythoichthys intestinalis]